MPDPGLNDTRSFYAGPEDPSLFWEMTVCQCLADLRTPYQAALTRPARYGELLARFLGDRLGLAESWSVVEVGGGYGSLMAALLDAVPLRDVTMVDLSPAFLGAQRRALADRPGCRFELADAVAYLDSLQREVDLVISNENIGDFPCVVGLSREEVLRASRTGREDGLGGRVAALADRYGLDFADAPETFAFNLGAVRFLERLRPRARRVFLCEHGADTVVPPPWGEFLSPTPGDGYPRRIPLKGHDEYTIRFGHLARVGERLGYRVERFHLAEVLGLRSDEGIRAMARCAPTCSEVAEVVHEFCGHVADYQGMLLVRET